MTPTEFGIFLIVLLSVHAIGCVKIGAIAMRRFESGGEHLSPADRAHVARRVFWWISGMSLGASFAIMAALLSVARRPPRSGWVALGVIAAIVIIGLNEFRQHALFDQRVRGGRANASAATSLAFRRLLLILTPVLLTIGPGSLAILAATVSQSSLIVRAAAFVGGALAGLVFTFAAFPHLVRMIFRAEPLDDGWRERLRPLERTSGVRIDGVYRIDRAGDMVNAMVTGIVPSHQYVYLTDALLQQLEPDEVVAVVAHELAHVRHRHLTRVLGGAVAGLLIVVGVVTGVRALLPSTTPVAVRIAAGPLLSILITYGFLVFVRLPAIRRNEGEADRTAREWVGADVYDRALRRIHDLNLSSNMRNRVEAALATHPTLDERLRRG